MISPVIMETFISSLQGFSQEWPQDYYDLERVVQRYPFRVNRYYTGLMQSPGDAIWRQVVPDIMELEDGAGWKDPLAEENLSPVPNLVHRYPNRVLWLVSQTCAVHCRFCTRKRRWKEPLPLSQEYFEGALDYIASHREVLDVVLSGGDPLLLPLSRLESILLNLRKIPHVGIIRIGTRVPCALPHGITPELVGLLARYHPIFMNIHFNHPSEITPESSQACALLADAGIPLGSQTVLLRGINDRADVLAPLFQGLLSLRVRPYYLMQMDLTEGTAHFRTSLSSGLSILKTLRNRISGLAMPHFVIDLPGGRGKVPLVPGSVEAIEEGTLVLKDYLGNDCSYPLIPGEDKDLGRWLHW
jgi:lysine 2,3-aminomutase